MKSKVKAIAILLITILLILTSVTIVFADSYTDGDKKTYTPKEFTKNPDGNTEGGQIKTTGTGVKNVQETGGKIVGLIRVVGTIVAVGMMVILGIKYMMGSAEERAEYKKTMFPYIVGAVLIFAATSLAQVIYTWASEI